MDLKDIKLEYYQKELSESSLAKEPLIQVKAWLDEVIKLNITYPNAATLSTVGKDSTPQSRIVLIKEVDEEGLIFYTNYESSKAKDIEFNPKVQLSFFWKELDRQIRITGTIKKTTTQKSHEYFLSRPTESQASAIASPQSHEVAKEELEKAYSEALEQVRKKPECPKNWGGYIIKIETCEFWQGRPNRLHDRFLYKSKGSQWDISRLAP